MPARRLTLYQVSDCAGRFLPWTGPLRCDPDHHAGPGGDRCAGHDRRQAAAGDAGHRRQVQPDRRPGHVQAGIEPGRPDGDPPARSPAWVARSDHHAPASLRLADGRQADHRIAVAVGGANSPDPDRAICCWAPTGWPGGGSGFRSQPSSCSWPNSLNSPAVESQIQDLTVPPWRASELAQPAMMLSQVQKSAAPGSPLKVKIARRRSHCQPRLLREDRYCNRRRRSPTEERQCA